MKGQSYYFEFNPIIQDLASILDERQYKSDSIQLQFKYAYLKKCTSQQNFKALVTSSMVKPIIFNQLKDNRNYKINSKCEVQQYKNAMNTLRQLQKKSECEVSQIYQLFANNGEQKYCYECKHQEWIRLYKEQLFRNQFNVMSKNTLFRIDLSQKIREEKHVLDKIKDMMERRKRDTGVLRFKHTHHFKIHQNYYIASSIVYETDEEQEFAKIKKLLISKGEDIAADIIAIMNSEEKKGFNIKYQLQLRFTQEGVDRIKTCKTNELKTMFSQAFNFVRDLSIVEYQEDQLIKLMKGLGLEEKKEQEKHNSKQEEEEEYIVPKKINAVEKK